MQVGPILYLWSTFTLVKGNFNLTSNAKTHDGLLCPDITRWTCSGDTNDTVIRWWLGNATGIYTEIENNDFPGVIRTTTHDKNKRPLTGHLEADPYKLQDMEYYWLACGTYSEKTTYKIPKLDIEKPKPHILSIESTYDGHSTSLRELTVKTARNVYKQQSCMYRKFAFFKTTVQSNDGTELNQTKVTPLNSSHCTILGCITTFTFNETTLTRFLTVNVTVEDSFHHSQASTRNIQYVQTVFLLLDNRNCRTVARCTTAALLTKDGLCNISYSSIYEKINVVEVPVNQDTPLTIATDTNYTVEAVIAHDELEKIRVRTNLYVQRRFWQCRADLEVLLGVIIAALLLLCPCSLAVLFFCAHKRKKLKSQRGRHLREQPFLMELNSTDKEGENDYAQLEHPSRFSALKKSENYSYSALRGGEKYRNSALEGGENYSHTAFRDSENYSHTAFRDSENYSHAAFRDSENYSYSALEGGENYSYSALEGGEKYSYSALEKGENDSHAALRDSENYSYSALEGSENYSYSALKGREHYSLLEMEKTNYDVLQRKKVQVAVSSV